MAFVISLRSIIGSKASNEWLMLQYRLSQEPKYIEQLYNNCANDLFHFLCSQSEPELAKEVCHFTWVKVMEKRNQFYQDGKFKNWLFTIGRHLLIDELRRVNKLKELSEELGETSEASIELERSNKRKLFDMAIQQLPFFQREALILSGEGFGLQEISDITGDEIETIKSRIRYAKQKLKKVMRKYYE